MPNLKMFPWNAVKPKSPPFRSLLPAAAKAAAKAKPEGKAAKKPLPVPEPAPEALPAPEPAVEAPPAPEPVAQELSTTTREAGGAKAAISGRSLLSPHAKPFYPASAASFLPAARLTVFPSPSKVSLTGLFGKTSTASSGISLGLAQPPPRLVFPVFAPRSTAPCTVTSGALAAAPPPTPPSPPPPFPPSPSVGSLAEPDPTMEPLESFRSEDIQFMLKIKEQYTTKLEGREDALTVTSVQSHEDALTVSSVPSHEDDLTVSSVPSQDYYKDRCHLLPASSSLARSSSPPSRSPSAAAKSPSPLSRSPSAAARSPSPSARSPSHAARSSSPPDSSLRCVTVLDCPSSPRRARSSSKKRHSPGSLPPTTPVSKPYSAKCPRGPAKSRLERVNTFRMKKRLEREEEEERLKEERKQERYEEIKELVRLERERRKQEAELMAREAAELVGEEGMVLDEGEELPQVEDVSMEQQEHVTTSWTAETPYGAMAKTSFRDSKVKIAALLQQYPLQEQMDLMMNLAAARSLPTLKCPLNKQKMRMTVSRSDLLMFLQSP